MPHCFISSKNMVKNILLAWTANAEIAIYIPSFCFSFLCVSWIDCLNINIIAINNNELIRNVNIPFIPKPIAVPTNTATYNIPTGILLLQAAANMASPNGANSPLKLTIDINELMIITSNIRVQ